MSAQMRRQVLWKIHTEISEKPAASPSR